MSSLRPGIKVVVQSGTHAAYANLNNKRGIVVGEEREDRLLIVDVQLAGTKMKNVGGRWIPDPESTDSTLRQKISIVPEDLLPLKLKARRDTYVLKKKGRLCEMGRDVLNTIYSHVFVRNKTIPLFLSVDKALREMFFPPSYFNEMKRLVLVEKALHSDAVRETKKLKAAEAKIIEEALTSGIDPAPEGQTPNMATMADAVVEAEGDEKEAELKLERLLASNSVWWEPHGSDGVGA